MWLKHVLLLVVLGSATVAAEEASESGKEQSADEKLAASRLVFIVIEALKSDDGYRWHYSLAPMTGYALKASLDGQPIWEVPWRKPPFDPREPFFIRVHSQPEKRKGFFDFFR